MQLVLSLCTGFGLLDMSFREAGFCVVSAGDLITGQDIRDFTGVKNKFDGIISGPPCQDFSSANRDRPVLKNSYGLEMLNECKRVILECDSTWALIENVRSVPNLLIDGYNHQRIDINQSWYDNVNRLRHIQFYHKQGKTLQINRNVTLQHDKLYNCALASDSRSFSELKRLQGLPDDFDLPSFNVAGKKRAVGNGFPLSVGRVLAKAVTALDKNSVTYQGKICLCGCGRNVTKQRAKYYDYSCRKRAERKRKKNQQLDIIDYFSLKAVTDQYE